MRYLQEKKIVFTFIKEFKDGEKKVCPLSEYFQQGTQAVLFLLHSFQTS